jgi:hypothetical protein
MLDAPLHCKRWLAAVLVLGIILGKPSLLGRAATQTEIWELWKASRVSGSDPYQLRHTDLETQLKSLLEKGVQRGLSLEVAGHSAEGRNLNLIQWGQGGLPVLLWSQMHGDEPTGTAALLDIMNFLIAYPDHPLASGIRPKLHLLMMPMLNPDGAERTRRRNAQGIDINRDAMALTTPEGRTLKAVRDRFKPEIGFNLHNQNPRTSVGQTGRPVTISLLAVPFDKEGNNNPGRIRSKKICSLIYQVLGSYCYAQIARYDDSFNIRAFGDQMTAWGTPTVLIESGWAGQGGDEYLVRINFLAILSVLESLANGSIEAINPAVYDALLQNETGLIYDIIIQGATLLSGNRLEPFRTDVAINISDSFDEKKQRRQVGSIAEVGDLGVFSSHKKFDSGDLILSPSDIALGPPRGEIHPGSRDLYIYRKKNPGAGLDPANLLPVASLHQGVFEDKGLR